MVIRTNTGGTHEIVYNGDKPRPLSPAERKLINNVNEFVRERREEKEYGVNYNKRYTNYSLIENKELTKWILILIIVALISWNLYRYFMF